MPYIVHSNETIDGCGGTTDAAWVDALRTMRMAGIEVLEETPEGDHGPWALERNFKIMPATDALLAEVESKGGHIAWFVLSDGKCGTRAEYEER